MLGLLTIKAAGGVVLVEDPTTAEHKTMLVSAIDHAPVDGIRPVATIVRAVAPPGLGWR
jgi:chemotaxis response regulator CheB